MSYSLIVENETDESKTLTHSDICDVLKIDGLTPAAASVNSSRTAGADGSQISGVYIPNRNVVIYLSIKEPVEQNRQKLYMLFRVKKMCTLHYISKTRNVRIKGVVESFADDIYSKKQIAQISIICPNPFLENNTGDYVSFSETLNTFEFPFSIPDEGIEFGTITRKVEQIIDAGAIDTGAVFHLNIDGTVSNPAIYNLTTQEYFSLTGSFVNGDEIIINTQKGQKSVYLLRNGEKINILGNRVRGSTWLQLVSGINIISFSADGKENITLSVEFTKKYEGV